MFKLEIAEGTPGGNRVLSEQAKALIKSYTCRKAGLLTPADRRRDLENTLRETPVGEVQRRLELLRQKAGK